MKNYEEEFQKFQLNLKDLPKYDNAENFANNFKKCSLYEYGNTFYSNSSTNNKINIKK